MHGSILTTLYIKLPFAYETVAELLEQHRAGLLSPDGLSRYDKYSAIVDNFLPQYESESQKIKVSFRLICRELDAGEENWQTIKSSVRGHQIRSVVADNSLHETHGHNLVVLEELHVSKRLSEK